MPSISLPKAGRVYSLDWLINFPTTESWLPTSAYSVNGKSYFQLYFPLFSPQSNGGRCVTTWDRLAFHSGFNFLLSVTSSNSIRAAVNIFLWQYLSDREKQTLATL